MIGYENDPTSHLLNPEYVDYDQHNEEISEPFEADCASLVINWALKTTNNEKEAFQKYLSKMEKEGHDEEYSIEMWNLLKI